SQSAALSRCHDFRETQSLHSTGRSDAPGGSLYPANGDASVCPPRAACPGGDRCDLFGSTLVLESAPIRALTSTERMTPRICPKCQRPQAWEMWRHCPCGYDFGPPRPGYSMEPEPKHRAR